MKKAIAILLLALMPLVAQSQKSKPQKLEKNWDVNVSSRMPFYNNPINPLEKSFDDFHAKHHLTGPILPFSLYFRVGIEKYIRDFSAELYASRLTPQITRGEANIPVIDSPVRILTEINERINKHTFGLNLKYNFPMEFGDSEFGDMSFGVGAGIIYGTMDVNSSFRLYHTEEHYNTAHSNINTPYRGFGAKINMNVQSNVRISDDWYLTLGLEFSIHEKVNLKAQPYNIDTYNMDRIDLPSEIEDDRSSSSFVFGAKKVFNYVKK